MGVHQQECLDKFKEWIAENNMTENPWHKDYFLLKFCRARKFDLEKVKEMFTNYMNYRKENELDTICQVSPQYDSNFILDILIPSKGRGGEALPKRVHGRMQDWKADLYRKIWPNQC